MATGTVREASIDAAAADATVRDVVAEDVRPAVASRNKSSLTAREMDVLRLMTDGLTTRQIADQLGMRFKTAACHRNRILQKLEVKFTVSAVLRAMRAGLIAV